MNTKELCAKLDEIAASVEPMAKEQDARTARLIALAKEYSSIAGEEAHLVSWIQQLEYRLVNSTFRADARSKVFEALDSWLAKHGLGAGRV